MIRNSDGRDGLVVFWDSGEVDRALFAGAMSTASLNDYIPEEPDRNLAIRNAARDALREFGMVTHGSPAEPKSLARESIGCDMMRIVRGTNRNTYPHMFTVAVTYPDRAVVTFSDPVHGFSPSIAYANKDGLHHGVKAAEVYMTERYRHDLQRISGQAAGGAVRRAVVEELKGVPLSRTGKCFFVPSFSIGRYETLALCMNGQEKEGEGMAFGWYRHTIDQSSHSFDQLCEAVRAEAQEIMAIANEDLANSHEAGRKMRSDCRDNRISDINAGLEKMQAYERLLGVTFDDLRMAMEQVRGVLAMQALTAVSA